MKLEKQLEKAIKGYLRSVYRRKTNLEDNLIVERNTDNISVYLPEYVDDIQKGRKPGETPIKISSLLQWMRRSGIRNSIVIAYRIQRAIVRRGIKPKNILGGIDEVIEETVNQYFTVDIDDNFNIKIK